MKQQILAMATTPSAMRFWRRWNRPRALCEVIALRYPKAGNGRSPIGLERMLRMYFVQH